MMSSNVDDAPLSDNDDSELGRTYRDGLDFRRTTLSQLKQSTVTPVHIRDTSLQGGSVNSASAPSQAAATPATGGVKPRVKRALKAIIMPFVRAAKPVGRPILGRIRRSMLEQWQYEVRAARAELRYLVEVDHARLERIEQTLRDAAHLGELQRQSIEAFRSDLQRNSQASERHVQGLERLERLESATRDSLSHVSLRLQEIERLTGITVRRSVAYLGNGEALVRTEVGYVVCSTADPALISVLMETSELERGTRLLIERFLAPGDVFVDAGANVGMHTLAAARAVGPRGRVIAIEPFDLTARLLRKSVALNGLSEAVEFHVAALSDHVGVQTFYLGSTNAHHSLYPLPEYTLAMGAPVEVPVTTLDTIMASHPRADLIKVDVEGAELDVIAGASATLTGNPGVALIVEFGPAHLRRTGHDAGEWLAAFERLGFAYQVVNEETGVLEQWSLERLSSVDSVNLFFARPNTRAWVKASAS